MEGDQRQRSSRHAAEAIGCPGRLDYERLNPELGPALMSSSHNWDVLY